MKILGIFLLAIATITVTAQDTGDNGRNDGTSDSSSNQKECTKEGYFRNPIDCTKFYRCLDPSVYGQFVLYDFSCSGGLVFDETERVCSSPSFVNPYNGENEGTSDSASIQKGCTEDGYFRNPGDCTKFYRCFDPSGDGQFVKFDYDCPEGLVFDETFSICSSPDSSNPCD